MDNLIDFYRRTRAAQRLAESQGLVDAAAALERAVEKVLREFGGDASAILCLTSGPSVPFVPSAGLLPITRQPQH